MAVVINGTTGITSVNGSASAPSVTGTDTDTGIVYGTNTLSLATGGTTAVTVDSSQNVGIGTSSPAAKLDVSVAGEALRLSGSTTLAYIRSVASGVNQWYVGSGGTAGLQFYTYTTTPMTFNVNASEAMRIDTSGNVGIGTSSPSARLQVESTTNNTAGQIGGTVHVRDTTSTTGVAGMAGTVFTSGPGTDFRIGKYWPGSGSPRFVIGNSASALGTDFVNIDSSGNVGIGTSSPVAKLTAITTSGATAFATGSGNQNFYVSADTAARYVTLASSGDLAGGFKFNVGNSEVMRIDLSGKLLVGTTSAYEQLTVGGFCSLNNQQAVGGYASTLITNCNGGSYYGIMIKNASTSNSNAMTFINSSGSPNGSIAVTTTTTAYNTSSDYRLKENIQPMTGALAAVAQLKPCTYTWKETGEASQGFIAHELAEVVPQCVTGEKDAVNEDGSIKPQGIDTSFLVATLTAAIQEQQAIIEQLRADVAQLKGQA